MKRRLNVSGADDRCADSSVRDTNVRVASTAPSIGTVADSYDNALAEAVNALFKTELHRNSAVLSRFGGHWKGLDDLEIATCEWVLWFNEERLHGELDHHTPSEVEEDYRVRTQTKAA